MLVLNAAMLGGTVTEGAHYFCDIFAGIGMAFFAHALAKRIIRAEDLSFNRLGIAGGDAALIEEPLAKQALPVR